MGHVLGQLRTLFSGTGDDLLLQLGMERLLTAIGGADEGRQPAEIEELPHHPHPGAAQLADAPVRGHDHGSQPVHPAGVSMKAAKAAGAATGGDAHP